MERWWPDMVRQVEEATRQGAARSHPERSEGPAFPLRNLPTCRLVNCLVCGKLGPLPPVAPGFQAGACLCQECYALLDERDLQLISSSFAVGLVQGCKLQYQHDSAALEAAQQTNVALSEDHQQAIRRARAAEDALLLFRGLAWTLGLAAALWMVVSFL